MRQSIHSHKTNLSHLTGKIATYAAFLALYTFAFHAQSRAEPSKIFTVTVACKAALQVPVSHKAPRWQVPVDQVIIQNMVRSGAFDALEAALNDCQKAFMEDRINDVFFRRNILNAFENSDPDFEIALDRWVREKPNSAFAHLARGILHMHIALLERGKKFVSKTDFSQIERFKQRLLHADGDLSDVVRLNPKTAAVYSYMIRSAMGTGDAQRAWSVFAYGLKNTPASLELWHAQIWNLQPRWGGSIENMRTLAGKAAPYLQNTYDQSWFLAWETWLEGDHLEVMEKKKKEGAILKSKAMKMMPDQFYANYWAGLLDGTTSTSALALYDKALDANPYNRDALKKRSAILALHGQKEKALSDVNLVLKMDALDPEALVLRSLLGAIPGQAGEENNSLQDSLNSTKYDKSAYTWHVLGLSQEKEGHMEDAGKAYSEAVKKDPLNLNYLYSLTANQYRRKDCGMVTTSNTFISVCNATGAACTKEQRIQLDWAKKASDDLVRRNVCSKDGKKLTPP